MEASITEIQEAIDKIAVMIYKQTKDKPWLAIPLIQENMPRVKSFANDFDMTRFQMFCFFGEEVELIRLHQLKESLCSS